MVFFRSLALVLLLAGAAPALAAQETEPPPEPRRDGGLEEGLTSSQEQSVALGDERLSYRVETGFLTLRDEQGEPQAALFYSSYSLPGSEPRRRPVTFALNGGPGAASAYLHLGMLGPWRVDFPPDGANPPPPARLVENAESWLPFTDIVFLDPVGTGFSYARPTGPEQQEEPSGRPFWSVTSDIESLGAAIRLWLTRNRRWESPKVLAGESFGGFRTALLAAALQEQQGIALSGAILVSPVIEYALTGEGQGSEVLLLPWAVSLPSYAATALHHGRGDFGPQGQDRAAALAEVEDFARGDFLVALARGSAAAESAREAFYARLARYTGLPAAEVRRLRGRIALDDFAKLLLRDEGRLLGFYDATVTGWDPDPQAADYRGRGEPTMTALDTVFTAGINAYWGQVLGLDSERRYQLLSEEVFHHWQWAETPGSMGHPGALDSLALALAQQPELRVWIQHGLHDLVTPYFASLYLLDQAILPPALRARIAVSLYDGGHMFYTHEASRRRALAEAQAFYAALAGR